MLPSDKADFPKMLLGIRELVTKKVSAESIVAAVANSLARARYPLLPKLACGSRTLSSKSAVQSFAKWLLAMELNDAGFWLGAAYAELVPEKKREKRAMFFTPPVLGDRILRDLQNAGVTWAEAKIIDLACGGAAFLAPAAHRIAVSLTEQGLDAERALAHIESHLIGIEVEPFLAKLSKFCVGMTLYPWIEAAGRSPAIAVIVGDALKQAPLLAGKFDAVICNPPYRKLTKREVTALPKNLRELCYLQPNLYGLFMAVSIQLLNEKGVAGLLTPVSFSSGKSFVRLRTHLTSKRHVASIDIVEERLGVFWGVEQETAISVFSPKLSDATHTHVFARTANGNWKQTGRVVLDISGGPWILPRHERDVALLSVANGRRMADYGYSATVGDVVLHRDSRRRFPTLKAAHLAKAVKPVPMLRASEIRMSGKLEFERSQRPDCYIDVGTAPQGLVRGPAVALQRVTSRDQGRRLICAPVPRAIQEQYGGVVGENHVNFLVATGTPAVRPALFAKILGSEPVDRLFRCRSGATNVSVYELTHLPLPDPDVVRKQLAAGADIDTAVWVGFGIDARSKRK